MACLLSNKVCEMITLVFRHSILFYSSSSSDKFLFLIWILNTCFFDGFEQNKMKKGVKKLSLSLCFLFQICLLSMMVCREFPSDECKNEIRLKKIQV